MFQRTTVGNLQERRVADAIDPLDRRKEPRSQYISVDFGSTPTTSASSRVSGLSWLTYDHAPVFSLTSQAQLTADLRVAAIDIEPGKGFTLIATSSSSLSGAQRIAMVVV